MTQPKQIESSLKARARGLSDDMAENLYRGIAGFTKAFKTHAEIRDYIESALLSFGQEVLEGASELVDDLKHCIADIKGFLPNGYDEEEVEIMELIKRAEDWTSSLKLSSKETSDKEVAGK